MILLLPQNRPPLLAHLEGQNLRMKHHIRSAPNLLDLNDIVVTQHLMTRLDFPLLVVMDVEFVNHLFHNNFYYADDDLCKRINE